MSGLSDALALTRDLVRFESSSHLSNVEVSRFIADRLEQLGFEVELVPYVDHAGTDKVNVVGRCGEPSGSASPGLAYFCHSDVVPAEDWTGPGSAFSPTEQDSRLFGRGSCDMKGSAACMLTALAQVDLASLRSPVYFVCTADEERSYEGARHVVLHSKLYREMVAGQPRVIIGEPTELRVVHAHKGICKLKVTSVGQAAHSSTREGLNANLAMIPFLQELKAIYDRTEAEAVLQNEEFEPPSMSWNIGINDHTAAINVKPAQSVCTVFFRPLPDVDDTPLIEEVRAAATRHGLAFAPVHRCDAMYTDVNDDAVVSALQLTGQVAAETVSYGTDGGMMPELRHKIVIGPGSIAQAHTSDEWIDLEQLERGTALYQKFLQAWCINS